jgi:magnesium transporter
MDPRPIRRSHKAGMPPGSLVYLGRRKVEKTTLEVIDYDAERLEELQDVSLEGCHVLLDKPTVTWINVNGLHDVEVVEHLGRDFGIHPLVLEDLLNPAQRPKLEDYDTHQFIVLKMLSWDEERQNIVVEQVGMVLGPSFLVTFQERGGDVFDPVRLRLRGNRGRIRRQGPDYLLYALLDAIVDNYFVILERLDDRIEALEERLTDSPGPETLREVHRLKREMIFLRRAVWPLREVLSGLQRDTIRIVKPETRLFLRDVYDHTIQVIDTVETFRDLLQGMLDVYMSTVSNRLNQVMKVLTIISTIFIPLNFIAGVYGMNFRHMPELASRWGYPIVLGSMVAVGITMLALFKKRGWF